MLPTMMMMILMILMMVMSRALCEDGDEKDWLSDSSVKPGRASPIEPFKIGAAQSAQSARYHPGQLGPTVFGAIVHNRAEQNMIASNT